MGEPPAAGLGAWVGGRGNLWGPEGWRKEGEEWARLGPEQHDRPPRTAHPVCTGPAGERAELDLRKRAPGATPGWGGGGEAAGEAAAERPSLRAACSPGCANGGGRSRSSRFGQLDEGKAELESQEEPGLSLLGSFPGERQEQHPERSQPRRASSPASRARDCTGAGGKRGCP